MQIIPPSDEISFKEMRIASPALVNYCFKAEYISDVEKLKTMKCFWCRDRKQVKLVKHLILIPLVGSRKNDEGKLLCKESNGFRNFFEPGCEAKKIIA